jgi:hypothetical protein
MTRLSESLRLKLHEIIEHHTRHDASDHLGSIRILFFEFARRMLIWAEELKERDYNINLDHNILFDVAKVITGESIDIDDIFQLVKVKKTIRFNLYDRLLLSYYINWESNQESIRKLGYRSPDPYIPLIEIMKRGGRDIRYEYSSFEMFPFYLIKINPKENFMIKTPFYNSEEDLIEADKNWKDRSNQND